MRAGVGKKAELGSPAMSQHVCARRILLEQQENERRDEQDGDGQHAERGVAGQGRGVATRKVPMIEAVLGKKQ